MEKSFSPCYTNTKCPFSGLPQRRFCPKGRLAEGKEREENSVERKKNTIKICGLPKTESTLYLVTAVVWIVLGILGTVLSEVAQLGAYRQYPIPGIMCICAIAAGVLMLAGRKIASGQTWFAALVLLTVAAASSMDDKLILTFGLLLTALSAAGFGFNRAPGFLPESFRMPVLNLVSVVLELLYAISSFSIMEQEYRVYDESSLFSSSWEKIPTVDAAGMVALSLALAAGAVLLNLCVNAQMVDRTAQPKERPARMKSVPGQGPLVTAAAILMLLNLADFFWSIIQGRNYFSPIALLWALVVPVAGGLLLVKEGRDKRALAAIILLLTDGLYYYRMTNFLTATDLLLALLPAVLMLAANIGLSWNRVPEKLPAPLRVPVLNLAAGAVALVQILMVLWEEHPALSGDVFMYLILSLLTPVALLLLNLGMESQLAAPRKSQLHGQTYAKGLTGIVQRFYGDVGGSLKMLAKIYGVLCLIAFLLFAVVAALGVLTFLLALVDLSDMEGTELILMGLVGMLSSVILAVGSWPLYAFGQITSDIREIKTHGLSAAPAAAAPPQAEASQQAQSAAAPQAEENPDDLPEL